MDQKKLIERIQNGEDSAFAELIHPLIEKGYRTSYSILRSKEQAEEVVQNAMIEAYRKHNEWEGNPFFPYMVL